MGGAPLSGRSRGCSHTGAAGREEGRRPWGVSILLPPPDLLPALPTGHTQVKGTGKGNLADAGRLLGFREQTGVVGDRISGRAPAMPRRESVEHSIQEPRPWSQNA